MGHPYNGNNSKEIKKIITLEYNEEINGTKKKVDVCSKITSLLLATFSASQLAGAPHQRTRLSSAKKGIKIN